MHQLSIEVCHSREEANIRREIIKAVNPTANWKTKIVENISTVTASLVTDIEDDPEARPEVFTPTTANPPAPAVVLLVWTED